MVESQKIFTFMTTGIPLSASTLAANGEPRYASRLYLPQYEKPLKRIRSIETNPPCTAKIATVGVPPYLYREFLSNEYYTTQSLHQRFLQYLRDEISLVGMVERRNVELELIGDLHKRVSASTVICCQTNHLHERGHRDQLVAWEPINTTTLCTSGNTLPAS